MEALGIFPTDFLWENTRLPGVREKGGTRFFCILRFE
jgi:hypothetical protein